MMKFQVATRFALLAVCTISMSVAFPAANVALGQPARGAVQDDDLRSELGERQRLVERKMAELENMFTVIAANLAEKEPERAKRLVAAYQRAKESLITRRMAEISQHLDRREYLQAQTKIDEVIEKLDDLVRLLTGDTERKVSKEEEINMLENWKQAIQQMRDEQNQQRRETAKVAEKDKTLEKLDEQLKRVNELIDRQRQVMEATGRDADKGLRAMDRLADEQFEVRKETEKLAGEIAADDSIKPETPGNGEPEANGNPGQQKPGETKPDSPENKPGQSNSENNSDQPGSEDSNSSDQNPPDSSSSENQPEDSNAGQPNAGQPGSSQNSPKPDRPQPPQPGQKPLEQAAEHQRQAEERLGSGRAEDAQSDQQKAIEELEKARDELDKERRRLASLPPEAFEQMAREQQRLRDKALELNKQMAEAPKPQPDSDNPDASPAEQQPGQQAMQEAGEAMKQAQGDLQNKDAKPAERKQQLAEKKLDEALEEIEERLEQLRDETREEKLKALEARFREMLDRQRVATVVTTELNDKKANLGNLHRRDELTMVRLATEEMEISELGQQAYDLLLEDGTSEVFPEIVQDLREDLNQVAQLLDAGETSQLTQLIQRDIEAVLIDLLDALEESKQQNESDGGGGGGGGGDGNQPLLKLSAELKILRSAQHRLNRRTIQIDTIRRSDVPDDVEQRLADELDNLAEFQRRLLEMTEEIILKQNDQ